MKEHSKRPFVEYTADDDAEYEQVINIDLSEIEPTVSFPHLPENTHVVGSFDDIKIDQVVIGSCTNGRIDDLRCAAKILKAEKWQRGCVLLLFRQHRRFICRQSKKDWFRHLSVRAQ